jgi:hypothetical protein
MTKAGDALHSHEVEGKPETEQILDSFGLPDHRDITYHLSVFLI